MGKALDLIGKHFGKLIVLCREANNKHGNTMWLCSCECGIQKVVNGQDLKNGKTQSCGCYQKIKMSKISTKHGHAGAKNSPEYIAWFRMKGRCLNKNDKHYKDYGGRGITVCERWMDFENFLSDMGLRPTKSHSIDRIDNNGSYSPDNCKWSTMPEQARNRRVRCDNKTGINGITWQKREKEYRINIGVSNKTIQLGSVKTLDEAIKIRLEGEQKYWGKSS